MSYVYICVYLSSANISTHHGNRCGRLRTYADFKSVNINLVPRRDHENLKALRISSNPAFQIVLTEEQNTTSDPVRHLEHVERLYEDQIRTVCAKRVFGERGMGQQGAGDLYLPGAALWLHHASSMKCRNELLEVVGASAVVASTSTSSWPRRESRRCCDLTFKMSFKSISNDLQKRIKDVDLISAKFSALNTDEERIRFNLELFREELNNLPLNRLGKCSEKSRKLRETGNDYFWKNDLWKAVILYTESAAYAQPNSEEVALAFGNRAAALLRLHLVKEALNDVEKALTMDISNNFRNKMTERKDKCLKSAERLVSSIRYGCGDVKLSTKSCYFSSASSLVEASCDDAFGRYLIASDDVQTGEVLVVEKPFSSIVIPKHFYTHCSFCFSRSFNLVPCPDCPTAMYCSEECLKQSRLSHKIYCKTLKILTDLQATTLELLSVKVLCDASHQGEKLNELMSEISNCDANNNKQTYNSMDHINIYKLVGNTEKRTISDLFHKSLATCIILTVLTKFSDFFDGYSGEEREHLIGVAGGLVLRYLQSMPCNAHEISEYCDDDYEEIGGGVYATLSLINHSCDPNVVRHCYKDEIVLRAIRPIKKGQQLFDNYGYHYALLSFDERQISLMQYYFECQCEACMKKWPLQQHLPELSPKFKTGIDLKKYEQLTETFKENVEGIFKGNCEDIVVESLMQYLNFLDEYVERPWKAYNICQEAIKHCLGLRGNCFRLSKGIKKV